MESKISLIAIDIGGTLLSDDNTITLENIDAIKLAKSKNIKIALATAREFSSTKYISNQINCDYGVFSNGSHILDIKNNVSLKISFLKTEVVLEIYHYCKTNNLYIHLNQEFCEVSDEMNYFNLKHHLLNENYSDDLKSNCYLIKNLEEYINCNTFTKIVIVSENSLENHLKSLKNILDKYNLFITEYNTNLYEHILNKTINYIEIGQYNDTKATGICDLADKLQIPIDEVLVIGDGENDINMFKKFRNSVCMNNGISDAKKLAGYVTTNDNNHSGVSEGIKYYLKKR